MMQQFSPAACLFYSIPHHDIPVQPWCWTLCSSFYISCWWGIVWVLTLASICWIVGAVVSCLLLFAYSLTCPYQVKWYFFPCPLGSRLSTYVSLLYESLLTNDCLFWLCIQCCVFGKVRNTIYGFPCSILPSVYMLGWATGFDPFWIFCQWDSSSLVLGIF